MKINKYIIFALISVLTFSCDLGTEPEIRGTGLQEMSGEWWVEKYDKDGKLDVDYNLITTSSTAKNTASELFFSELGHFENVKAKVISDISTFKIMGNDIPTLNFSVTAPEAKPVVSLGTKQTIASNVLSISLVSGSIFKKKFKAPSGAVTDSIAIGIEPTYGDNVFVAEKYNIEIKENKPDTTVVWKFLETKKVKEPIYYLRGYKRTGFLDDEH